MVHLNKELHAEDERLDVLAQQTIERYHCGEFSYPSKRTMTTMQCH